MNVTDVHVELQRCKLVSTKAVTQEMSNIYDDVLISNYIYYHEFSVQKKIRRKRMWFIVLNPSINKSNTLQDFQNEYELQNTQKIVNKMFQ